MTHYDYKRPKFRKETHNIRNFFILMAVLVIIGLGVFIYVGYSSSPKTSEPMTQSAASSSTINETIDSNVSEASDESSTSQANNDSQSSSSSSESSSSSSSSSSSANDKESAHLKGKTITEAIDWAKAHGRYYSWSITSGGDDAVVTSVTDDGHNISFVASEK